MKSFRNKQTDLPQTIEGEIVKMTYVDILKIGINTPPKEGWSIDQMKKSIDLIEKLKAAKVNDIVELEDAAFELAFAKIPTTWSVLSPDLVSFQSDMEAVAK